MSKNYSTQSRLEKNLAQAFTKIDTLQDSLNFLRDLLTPAELTELSNRFEIARLLAEGKMSYLQIAEKVGTSTATVTRVNLWLKKGCGGYEKVFEGKSRK